MLRHLTFSKRPGGSKAAASTPWVAPFELVCVAGTPPKAEPALARDACSMDATPCGDTCQAGPDQQRSGSGEGR